MDCYAVGPTLGGGTAALMPDSAIVYPYCYKDYEILDNGPLRFTVKLVFNPLVVKNDSNVVETRIIQLDKGSQLNKTTVSYEYLTQATPVAAGLVLHAANPEGYAYDAAKGYISYADPTTNAEAGNGIVYVGAVFPASVQTTTQLFENRQAMHWDMYWVFLRMNRVMILYITGVQAGANMVSKKQKTGPIT